MRYRWPGKTGMITGGSCRMALGLAGLMIDSEIRPVLTYRNQKGFDRIKDELSGFKGEYDTCHLDFSDSETINNLEFEKTGIPDYFVDFAQAEYDSLVAAADPDVIHRFITESISFRAMMLKSVTRQMLKNKKGRLVFISSTAAESPNPGQGFYSAVKLAGEGLYKNIGIELGAKGITAISLRPGYIDSGRGKKYLDRNGKEIIKKIPVRKVLTPVEVAETIMFFLSESATGFNGTEIVMDGGLTSGK